MPADADTLEALRRRIAQVEQRRSPLSPSADSDSEPAETRNRPGGKRRRADDSDDDEGKPKDVGPDAAFNRCVALISHSPRTTKEMRDRLKREGFPPASVDSAVGRALTCGLLDDGNYAEQYALTRISRGYGLRRIKDELARKGIDAERCDFWSDLQEEQDGDAEFRAALAFAKGKTFSSKHPDQALFAALVRRGYSTSCAYRVIRSMNDAD